MHIKPHFVSYDTSPILSEVWVGLSDDLLSQIPKQKINDVLCKYPLHGVSVECRGDPMARGVNLLNYPHEAALAFAKQVIVPHIGVRNGLCMMLRTLIDGSSSRDALWFDATTSRAVFSGNIHHDEAFM